MVYGLTIGGDRYFVACMYYLFYIVTYKKLITHQIMRKLKIMLYDVIRRDLPDSDSLLTYLKDQPKSNQSHIAAASRRHVRVPRRSSASTRRTSCRKTRRIVEGCTASRVVRCRTITRLIGVVFGSHL